METLKPTVTVRVEPLVAAYLIKHGTSGAPGEAISVTKIPGLDRIIKRYLAKQPAKPTEQSEKEKKKQDGWIYIELDVPYWPDVDVRVYNHLYYSTYSIINYYVLESLIIVDLLEELTDFYKSGIQLQDLILNFCVENGIECTEQNCERFKKRYYRFRKSQKAKK